MPVLTAVLVVASYAAIAVGRVPYLRMSRAEIALVSAALLVLTGALSEEQALESLDMGTILLLGAMMVLNVNLRLSGFFRWIGVHTLRLARSPRMLLALIIAASGVLSALFLNDPVCLMFTPLVVELTQRLKRDPVPYLVGLAAAANVGSVATVTGNPQNIIIGQASGIPYLEFFGYLGPVAAFGLVVCWLVIVVVYRGEFQTPLAAATMPPPRTYRPLLVRTVGVTAALVAAFFVGVPVVTATCIAAGALMLSRLRPQKLLALDWDLLAFFAGLFVVTGAIEATGLSERLFEAVSPVLHSGIPAFTVITGALSNVVSNVPAVLLLRPEIAAFPDPHQAWLVLAMASTLAGNFTLLGSAATLIVAEVAQAHGTKLGFIEFLKAGVPITLLTLLAGVLWLSAVT